MIATTFQNITQQLQEYSNDYQQCQRIILEVIKNNPAELPDPAKLCQVLKSTEYYKKESICILDDFFQLHEIHPIHLLLSLKDGVNMYSQLYDLYKFQNLELPEEKIHLIEKYKDNPEITRKQIEILVYDQLNLLTPDIDKAIQQTLYLKEKHDRLYNYSEVIPYSLIQQIRFSGFSAVLIALSEQARPETTKKMLNQASFLMNNCDMNMIAIEVELFKHDTIYESQRLKNRTKKLFGLVESLEQKGLYLPCYIK